MSLTDSRLTAIIEMLPECEIIADIGADHGRLAAQLLLEGRCGRAWLTDISDTSLTKARRLISRLNLSCKADFFMGDGALALPSAPNAAVIAGMGGETIADIVINGEQFLKDAFIVIQPNVAVTSARERLTRAGYRILNERVARASGRHYVIIALSRGSASYTRHELVIGPKLINDKTDEMRAYSRFRLRVAQKALAGARSGSDARTDELMEEVAIWQSVSE